MKETDLDKLFNETLKNASIQAPSGVWESISAATSAASSTATAAYVVVKWVAGSLLALSAATAIYFAVQSDSTSAAKQEMAIVDLTTVPNGQTQNENNSEKAFNFEFDKSNSNTQKAATRSQLMQTENTESDMLSKQDSRFGFPSEILTVNRDLGNNDDRNMEVDNHHVSKDLPVFVCPKLISITAVKTDYNTYKFEATNTQSLITWYFGDGTSSNSNPGIHTYSSIAKEYVVLVTGINVKGCNDTGRLKVSTELQKPNIFVPDYFTPNADGTNDEFYVSFENASAIDFYDLIVFDSRNRPVFKATNPNDKWDGTCGALECANGTYKVIINYRIKGSDNILTQKNSILLNR